MEVAVKQGYTPIYKYNTFPAQTASHQITFEEKWVPVNMVYNHFLNELPTLHTANLVILQGRPTRPALGAVP